MSIDENPHPTKRYVNLILLQMHKASRHERTLRKSEPLYRFERFPELEPPTFEHARNRLKVMAKIDHLTPLASPTTSTFPLIVSNEVDPATLHSHEYTVHLAFDDRAPDPSVHIRLEHLRVYTETGVLWR